MARLFYTLVFYCAIPIILLRLLWRARKAPAYKQRWSERFGFFPKPELNHQVIWIHAVSVGETLAAIPLIDYLLTHKPKTSIVVTSTTPTGSDRIQHRFGHLPEQSFFHVYCPYDLPDCVNRFLNRIRPDVFIVMETELWPNILTACRKRNIPALLANGRLSEKSARGYQKIQSLMQPAFAGLAAAAVQAEADGERMRALGLSADKCTVTGSIKFDLQITDAVREQASELRKHICASKPHKILIAASTHRGEDEIVLAAFKQIKQSVADSFLILVPRHPERFDEVADLLKQQDWQYNRRRNHRIELESDVLLGDTMGELLVMLGVADTAFIGGSLVPVGGHNLMEPAAWGLPILTGPHLHNFVEASSLLQDAGAMRIVQTAEQLSAAVLELWGDDEKNKTAREAALTVAKRNRGALDKLIKVIEAIIGPQSRSG